MKKANFELQGNRELNPPKFNSNEWEPFLNAGCYQYALDWKVDEFFLIGGLLGRACKLYTQTDLLIFTLMKELQSLHYEVEITEVEKKTKEGEKKVYLQCFPSIGTYHLLREDDDGIWSHKYPRELPLRTDSKNRIIKNPELMSEDFPFIGWCFLLKNRMS